jgi:hypothetical protein
MVVRYSRDRCLGLILDLILDLLICLRHENGFGPLRYCTVNFVLLAAAVLSLQLRLRPQSQPTRRVGQVREYVSAASEDQTVPMFPFAR